MKKKETSKPIYLQLREIIRNKIEEGEYMPGTAIPSENKLSEIYGINRITTRNAVEALVNEGLLRRVQGKGVFVVGGIVLSVSGLILGGKLTVITAEGIAVLAWLSFVSAAAYTLWGMLLSVNPVSRLSSIGFMNPVFGFILSLFLLKEGSTVGVSAIIALAVICIGIYLVNRESKAKKKV